MIPQYAIQEWHEQVPWNADAMVEKDVTCLTCTRVLLTETAT